MEIEIQFTDKPIPTPGHRFQDSFGAVADFWGVVRRDERNRKIEALAYEIYEPMGKSTIRGILEELNTTHPCGRVLVIHRRGVVPVGEASIYVRVESVHRAEAFQMLAGFMNRMKQEVPIWKTPVGSC